MAFTVNAASGREHARPSTSMPCARTPSAARFGVPSPASMGALVIHQLGKQLNLPLQAVPYRGGSPLLTDLPGNQIPVQRFDPARLPRIPPQRASSRCWPMRAKNDQPARARDPDDHRGRLSGLRRRHVLRPVWQGRHAGQLWPIRICAPSSPRLWVRNLSSKHCSKMGLVPVGGTPGRIHRKVLADRTRWAPVIKDAGIKMDA